MSAKKPAATAVAAPVPIHAASDPRAAMAASIKEFGFRQPIIVDEKSDIVIGHTCYQAAVKL